jgi:hypothetical protein
MPCAAREPSQRPAICATTNKGNMVKFTLLTRGVSDYLTSLYSERKVDMEKRASAVASSKI